MNSENDVTAAQLANPYSATAIALVSEDDHDPFTIDTVAVQDARASLDAYLESGRNTAASPGNVIAIIGEYGTGKTHIADGLLRRARSASKTVLGMYVDAPSADFLRLYRERFITKLDRLDVRARVRDYYADVVADLLGDSALTVQIVEGLRTRKIDPQRAVEELGLMESLLLQRLREKLRSVTDTETFGTVLALFLQPGFDHAVWDWLSGFKPDQILQDRGIATTIDSEELALEAIGVFAILYGSQQHRFVLVIDELEKVLSTPRPPGDEAGAFQKLLTVFSGSGGFLVLSGLPDFGDNLSESARQRIGAVIHTSALTERQTRELILGLQQQATRVRALAPFTNDMVAYLVRLSGGSVRKIIRLCHHAYRQAMEDGGEVTMAMVDRAVRERYHLGATHDIHAQIRQLLLSKASQPFIRNLMLGARVDYWIQVGDLGAGCALLVADPVVKQGDVDKLTARASAIRGAAPRCETLLVVDGFLAADLAGQLRSAFDSQPMVYEDSPRFSEDFVLTISEAVKRLETAAQVDTLTIIRSRVEHLSTQQSATQEFLQQLAVHVDSLRATSNRQLSSIYRILQDVPGPVAADDTRPGSGRGVQPPTQRRLPPEVAEHFDRALAAVDDISRLDAQLSDVFAATQPGAPDSQRTRIVLNARLQSPAVIRSTGVATILRQFLEAFRDGVRDWFDDIYSAGRRLTNSDEDRLHLLCETFDSFYDHLPVYQLDALVDLSGLAENEDQVTYSAKTSRRADTRDALDGLSGRIYRAALDCARASDHG
jgi:Cdc6-like AAA superfamily ATPase